MPGTGQTCKKSGIYKGDCNCSREISLSKGERFPPCSGCRKAVNWLLVRATR